MPGLEVKGYSIEDVTKGLAAGAVVAYVIGYVVLSFRLSSFGFNPISPLRPRILETGISTLVFILIPVALGSAVASISSRGIPKIHAIVLRLLLLPGLCGMISASPGFLENIDRSFAPRKGSGNGERETVIFLAAAVVTIAVITILLALARWVWKNYHLKTLTSILAAVPVSIVFFCFGLFSRDTGKTHALIWFLGVSVLTCVFIGSDGERAGQRWIDAKISFIKESKNKIEKVIQELRGESSVEIERSEHDLLQTALDVQKSLNAQLAEFRSDTSHLRLRHFIYTFLPITVFTASLGLVAIYSVWVFPYIPLRIGGGEMLEVSVYLSKESAPILHGLLLDQSDEGLLLVPAGINKGVFIPKEKYDAIYFEHESLSAK